VRLAEYQIILDFSAARNDEGGGGDDRDMQSSSQIIATKPLTLSFCKLDALPGAQQSQSIEGI